MKRLIFLILAVPAAWLIVTRLRRDDGKTDLLKIAEEARLTLAHFNRS